MSMVRNLALVAALGAATILSGCAGEREFTTLDGRVGQLEKGVSDLGKRIDALAAGDRQSADRAAKAAEDAKMAAEAARRAADAAAESSTRAEAMFRKSLRK